MGTDSNKRTTWMKAQISYPYCPFSWHCGVRRVVARLCSCHKGSLTKSGVLCLLVGCHNSQQEKRLSVIPAFAASNTLQRRHPVTCRQGGNGECTSEGWRRVLSPWVLCMELLEWGIVLIQCGRRWKWYMHSCSLHFTSSVKYIIPLLYMQQWCLFYSFWVTEAL